MFSYAFHLSLFLLYIFPTAHTADAPAYNPVDLILINCGATERANDTAGRMWERDERSRYSPADAARISNASTASHMDQSLPEQIPYETARIFHSRYKYSFPVASSGHKFLRLYFYPDTYAGFNTSQSFFSVTANDITLVSNFSASLNSQYLKLPYLTKEFIIYADGNRGVDLTFSPNPNSFAFVNGIEIVSLPDKLYFRNEPIKLVPIQLYDLKNGTGLETLYRLNVGGGDVPIQDDTGMFRHWSNDDNHILGADFGYTPHEQGLVVRYTTNTPPYSAPKIVYTTSRTTGNTSKSLEWAFPVDSGFDYLLRLHFCEFLLEITKQFDRMFTININNMTAEPQVDVIGLTHGSGIPIFKDYITRVPDDGHRGKQDMRLSLLPDIGQNSDIYASAFLNGLEIFKLSDQSQSLVAANPPPAPQDSSPNSPSSPPGKKKGPSSTIYAVIGSVIGVLAVVTIISFLIFRQRRKVKDSTSTKSSWVPLPMDSRTTRTSGSSKPLPSDLCKHFTLREILTATENFNDSHVIGKGGFGNVYKGSIDDTTVAVKRLNSTSSQGAREFLTEIDMLSKLRHLHLVSLIGFCYDHGEMILVYDYMAHGSLRDHLYNTKNTPLKWKERLQICMGAAKGLHYLHTGSKHPIIHRDVKSTNILLDEKWVAKMSDFGLSKVGSTDTSCTHVSTAVKGSAGYVDPEYWRLQQLTAKSDVYSFGVVLFEVLCARPAILQNTSREKTSLVEWAKLNYRRGTIDQIVDPNLKGQIAAGCLNKFVETAMSCLQDKGIQRPGMNDVVWCLDFALRLQDAAEKEEGGRGEFYSLTEPELTSTVKKDPNTTTDDEIFTGTTQTQTWSNTSGLPSSGTCGKLDPGEIFSEIKNPTAR